MNSNMSYMIAGLCVFTVFGCYYLYSDEDKCDTLLQFNYEKFSNCVRNIKKNNNNQIKFVVKLMIHLIKNDYDNELALLFVGQKYDEIEAICIKYNIELSNYEIKMISKKIIKKLKKNIL